MLKTTLLTTSQPGTTTRPHNFCHGTEHGRFTGLTLSALAKVYFPFFLGPPKNGFVDV
jgi:hypothetical protein